MMFRDARIEVEVQQWPMIEPFRITGHVFEMLSTVSVTIRYEGKVGRAEASGVYYRGEDAAQMVARLERLRPILERRINRRLVSALLPPCGARNALDCALWDLEAKVSGRPVWQCAGIDAPQPLVTTFTCGADDPEKMAATARGYDARAIKLKLVGDALDAQRVLSVRAACPDVWLGVDANQGFDIGSLAALTPTLIDCDVALVEQPFPLGRDDWLDGFDRPIPIAADESVQSVADIQAAASRFDVINIKLDKCGGLTEALDMAELARTLGLEVMVGNMMGTSLGMAPSYLVGQMCSIVDLDGPIFLTEDHRPPVQYDAGRISVPDELWGGA